MAAPTQPVAGINSSAAGAGRSAPRKFKASDLPLPSATRAAIESLAHNFKKEGAYDSIRKQVWDKFEASDYEAQVTKAILEVAEQEVERNPQQLLTLDRRKAAALIDGALERSGVYQKAEQVIDQLIDVGAIEARIREIRRAEIGDEAEAERLRGLKTDEQYAAETEARRADRERAREELRQKEAAIDEEKQRVAREERKKEEREREKAEHRRQAEREEKRRKREEERAEKEKQRVKERDERIKERERRERQRDAEREREREKERERGRERDRDADHYETPARASSPRRRPERDRSAVRRSRSRSRNGGKSALLEDWKLEEARKREREAKAYLRAQKDARSRGLPVPGVDDRGVNARDDRRRSRSRSPSRERSSRYRDRSRPRRRTSRSPSRRRHRRRSRSR
ncbi:U1 snRNP protein [Ophiocordyceps camponoti-floridani]|uniref:U1 snRNP protein n=1 Tax=Ophiocordyceps camponoti-floridani TaxID=2030778 RepID=A0A8H4Q425_9HYPO|nr:U1 snRNP protein [Ophiocordyceps camponoti-floridani]